MSSIDWIALADRHLEAQRVFYADAIGRLVGMGSIPAVEAETWASSEVRFASLMEGVLLSSGVGAGELEAFRNPSSEDLAVFRFLLRDLFRMNFVRALVHEADSAPSDLAFELARAAVYTVNPSSNGLWLMHVMKTNPEGVRDALLWFLEHGSAFEIGGASNAFYWFTCYKPAGVESRHERRLVSSLRRFVESTEVDVRQCLMASLSWNEADYPEEYRDMLRTAVAIASNHSDDYIRERYLCDTGESGLFPCLPHRSLESVMPRRG